MVLCLRDRYQCLGDLAEGISIDCQLGGDWLEVTGGGGGDLKIGAYLAAWGGG